MNASEDAYQDPGIRVLGAELAPQPSDLEHGRRISIDQSLRVIRIRDVVLDEEDVRMKIQFLKKEIKNLNEEIKRRNS